MNALSEALAAAQTRALGALQKAYVAGAIDAEAFSVGAEACGISDPVDMSHLLASLDVLKEWGAQAPEPAPKQKQQPEMTPRQRARILKDCKERGLTPPDTPLTMDQASEIIDSIDAGTYDPEKWRVPF